MTERKFYKTVIQIEVLSEEEYNPDCIEQITYDIKDGDCSGDWKVKSSKVLSGKQIVKELVKQGSDASFFQLDEKGNELEE